MNTRTTDPADLTDSQLIETADGMRFWWNDDNPDAEQQETYRLLTKAMNGIGNLTPEGAAFAQWEQYVMQLEEYVAEMAQRAEAS